MRTCDEEEDFLKQSNGGAIGKHYQVGGAGVLQRRRRSAQGLEGCLGNKLEVVLNFFWG